MRRLVLCSLLSILSACASTTKPSLLSAAAIESRRVDAVMPGGEWRGSVQWAATAALEGGKSSGMYLIRVSSCAGKVSVDVSEDGESYIPTLVNSPVEASADLYRFSFVDAAASIDPSWVEMQSFGMALREGDAADIIWSRMVNNRHVSSENSLRVFSQLGAGKLTRTSSSCKSESMDNKREKARDGERET